MVESPQILRLADLCMGLKHNDVGSLEMRQILERDDVVVELGRGERGDRGRVGRRDRDAVRRKAIQMISKSDRAASALARGGA